MTFPGGDRPTVLSAALATYCSGVDVVGLDTGQGLGLGGSAAM